MAVSKISQLNQFQKDFILWGWNKARAIVCASAGSGKSLAAVGYYAALSRKLSSPERKFGKLVIICKTKAVNVFDTAISALRFQSVKLTDTSDMSVFSSTYAFPSDIYLISSFLLSKLVHTGTNSHKLGLRRLLSLTGVLLLEEIHVFRSYKSRDTVAARYISNYFNSLVCSDPLYHRIIGLTATPVYKNILSLYSVFALIDPRLFGTYKDFLSAYCITEERGMYGSGRAYNRNGSYGISKSKTYTEVIGFKNLDILNAKIEPYLFHFKTEEFSFQYNLHYYSLIPSEIDTYNSIIDGLGLDKQYCITLISPTSKHVIFRDGIDILYQDKDLLSSVLVKDVCSGTPVFFSGEPCRIDSILENRKTAGYSTRCVKAVIAEGTAQNRLDLILSLVNKYSPASVLINCAYHNSIDTIEAFLREHLPGRRIVKLTGKTPNFQAVFTSIRWKSDIVILSRASGESLSMYTQHIIISELPTNPGSVEQLIGRVSRHDSPYRAFTVDILLNESSSITAYFYERLRYLLSSTETNTFARFDTLPPSKFMDRYAGKSVNIAWLKSHFLWKKLKIPKAASK